MRPRLAGPAGSPVRARQEMVRSSRPGSGPACGAAAAAGRRVAGRRSRARPGRAGGLAGRGLAEDGRPLC